MSLFDHTLRFLDSMDRVSNVVRSEARTRSFRPTDDGYELTVDMPGIGSEDVDVEIGESHVMTVRGNRADRSYEHLFVLPEDYDADNVEAEMKYGVLSVRIRRKAPETTSRKIKIM